MRYNEGKINAMQQREQAMLLNNGVVIMEGEHFIFRVVGKTATSYILENVANGEQTLLGFDELDLHFMHRIVTQ